MREFTCEKCGFDRVTVTYVKNKSRLNPERGIYERIACICDRCEFRWDEETSLPVVEKSQVERPR